MRDHAFVIFTKAPIPGYVKSRLSPPLTGTDCAELQAAFIRDAVSRFRALAAELKICFCPDDAGAFFDEFGVETYPQGKGDLGQRMRRCLQAELRRGFRKVLLAGADIPLLGADDVSRGYDLLDTADVVFGPARDGGYYCIGTRRSLPNLLFDGIPWSTPQVFEESEARARGAGLVTARMRTCLDVDRLEDLTALREAAPGGATQKVIDKLSRRIAF